MGHRINPQGIGFVNFVTHYTFLGATNSMYSAEILQHDFDVGMPYMVNVQRRYFVKAWIMHMKTNRDVLALSL